TPPRGAIRNPFARVSIRRSIYLVTAEKRAELKATDASLIDRIVQRDESALAALYDRYAGMLSSVLNRILRDTQAAEEILQDIFYQLWLVPMSGLPISAGVFNPKNGEMSHMMMKLPAGVTAKAFAVSLEPAGGMPQPTGPMVLVGPTS